MPYTGSGDGCNPGGTQNYYVSYKDGWDRAANGSYPGGVRSTIWNYSPFVSSVNGSSTQSQVTAWALLSDLNGHYAQIGWWEYPFGVRHTFEQTYGVGYSGPLTNFDPAQPVNTYTQYTTLWNNAGPGVFSFRYGGTQSAFTDRTGFTPISAQNYGETHSDADQMPGGSSAYFYYETMYQAQVYLGSSWQAFNGNYHNGGFNGYVANSGEVDIWDGRCPQ